MDKATEEKIWEWIQKYPTNKSDLTEHEKYCYEMGLRCGASRMVEWKQNELIEKTIDWLDSIMDYVSEKDKRLVCNFTNFDELVNDFKKAMKEE